MDRYIREIKSNPTYTLSVALLTVSAKRYQLVTFEMSISARQTAGPYSFFRLGSRLRTRLRRFIILLHHHIRSGSRGVSSRMNIYRNIWRA